MTTMLPVAGIRDPRMGSDPAPRVTPVDTPRPVALHNCSVRRKWLWYKEIGRVASRGTENYLWTDGQCGPYERFPQCLKLQSVETADDET